MGGGDYVISTVIKQADFTVNLSKMNYAALVCTYPRPLHQVNLVLPRPTVFVFAWTSPAIRNIV